MMTNQNFFLLRPEIIFAASIGPGSLPGYARRGRGGDYDDGASDISSTSGFGSAYGYRSGSSKFY